MKESSSTPANNTTPAASRATSVGASSSNESRKARRKHKKKKEKIQAPSEAGPSTTKDIGSKNSQNSKSSLESSGPSSQNNEEKSFLEADFIAFSFDDDELESHDEEHEDMDPKGKGKQRAASPSARGKDSYAREWDKGKSRLANDDRNHGRKRKVDEVDLNDGYENKKQRVNAASRRAPWVWDVDWDSCRNVAEMYALVFSNPLRLTLQLGICNIGFTEKLMHLLTIFRPPPQKKNLEH